jgi:hypothetical protein
MARTTAIGQRLRAPREWFLIENGRWCLHLLIKTCRRC